MLHWAGQYARFIRHVLQYRLIIKINSFDLLGWLDLKLFWLDLQNTQKLWHFGTFLLTKIKNHHQDRYNFFKKHFNLCNSNQFIFLKTHYDHRKSSHIFYFFWGGGVDQICHGKRRIQLVGSSSSITLQAPEGDLRRSSTSHYHESNKLCQKSFPADF